MCSSDLHDLPRRQPARTHGVRELRDGPGLRGARRAGRPRAPGCCGARAPWARAGQVVDNASEGADVGLATLEYIHVHKTARLAAP